MRLIRRIVQAAERVVRVSPDAPERGVAIVSRGKMTTTLDAPIRTELPHDVPKFEYMVVPLQPARGMKKDAPFVPDELNEFGRDGWEAVGLTLKAGDLVAWPVLLKRQI